MRSQRIVPALALCSLLALTACGGGQGGQAAAPAGPAAAPDLTALSGEEILAKASAAMAGTSFTAEGETRIDGAHTEVNLALSTRGDCVGTLTGGEGGLEIRHNAWHTWAKPDNAFWDGFASDQLDVEPFRGLFLTGHQDDAFIKKVTDACDTVRGLTGPSAFSGKVSKGPSSLTSNGTYSIALTVTAPDGSKVTAEVATKGTPYLTRFERSADNTIVNFGGYGRPVTVTDPGPGQTMDVARLEKADHA